MAETVSGMRTMVDGRALYAKISWRLIPYMFLLYIVAYMDRVNVGFAAMDMQRDLHFSNTVYGTGAGIFFLGYALCDLPSSLILRRGGARIWVARIMVSWGGGLAWVGWGLLPAAFYLLWFFLCVGGGGVGSGGNLCAVCAEGWPGGG